MKTIRQQFGDLLNMHGKRLVTASPITLNELLLFANVLDERNATPNPAKEIAALVELSLSPPVMGMGGESKTEEVNVDRWKQDVGREVVRLRKAYGGGAPAVDWLFDSLGQTFGV